MGLLSNVLGIYEESPLFELDEDLEGTLLCIAYAGKANNLKYIHGRINYLKKTYASIVNDIGITSTEGLDADSVFLFAIGCVCDAYSEFINEQWEEMSVPEREECAENILGEHHFLGQGEDIPQTLEEYKEIY